MADLKERMKKEQGMTPTESTVMNIVGKAAAKPKYPVNVIFDGEMESVIKARAKELGLGVATYIKMLVSQDLNGR